MPSISPMDEEDSTTEDEDSAALRAEEDSTTDEDPTALGAEEDSTTEDEDSTALGTLGLRPGPVSNVIVSSKPRNMVDLLTEGAGNRSNSREVRFWSSAPLRVAASSCDQAASRLKENQGRAPQRAEDRAGLVNEKYRARQALTSVDDCHPAPRPKQNTPGTSALLSPGRASTSIVPIRQRTSVEPLGEDRSRRPYQEQDAQRLRIKKNVRPILQAAELIKRPTRRKGIEGINQIPMSRTDHPVGTNYLVNAKPSSPLQVEVNPKAVGSSSEDKGPTKSESRSFSSETMALDVLAKLDPFDANAYARISRSVAQKQGEPGQPSRDLFDEYRFKITESLRTVLPLFARHVSLQALIKIAGEIAHEEIEYRLINSWVRDQPRSPRKERGIMFLKLRSLVEKKIEFLAEDFLRKAAPVSDDDLLKAQLEESLRIEASNAPQNNNGTGETETEDRVLNSKLDEAKITDSTVRMIPEPRFHYQPLPKTPAQRIHKLQREPHTRMSTDSATLENLSHHRNPAFSQDSYHKFRADLGPSSTTQSSRTTSISRNSTRSDDENESAKADSSSAAWEKPEKWQMSKAERKITLASLRASRRNAKQVDYNVRRTFQALRIPDIDSQEASASPQRTVDEAAEDTSILDFPEPKLDPKQTYSRRKNMASLLRHRELGFGHFGHGLTSLWGINSQLRVNKEKDMHPWRSWRGMSKDVLNVAWSPNGTSFAASASNDMDNLNIQYNKPNSLVYGDLLPNTLRELPDHVLDRPKPENAAYGENALTATYNALDQKLYTTVSSIGFSNSGKHLFSGGYDCTVRIWHLSESQPTCIQSLEHNAVVELLDLSHSKLGMMATAQKSASKTIRLYSIQQLDDREPISACAYLSGERASRKDMHPRCLRWGCSSTSARYLAAGFSEDRGNSAGEDRDGELCLWDVETGDRLSVSPASQNMFDIAWHPSKVAFAAATIPVNRRGYSVKSVIRIFSMDQRFTKISEFDCPAFDVNEVKFHPVHEDHVIAGCTDGCTYVWDRRKGDHYMHRLKHGNPLEPISSGLKREAEDTGIRFTAWGLDGISLYTGSSDGIVKSWDIRRNPEDVHIGDVATFASGIMAAAFSPDHSNLLVGTVDGAIHILSNSPITTQVSGDYLGVEHFREPITFIPSEREPEDGEVPESGITCAKELVESGQLSMHPTLGAGKGAAYIGPYAADCRPKGADPTITDLNPDVLASQLHPEQRRKGELVGGRAQAVAGEQTSWENMTKVARERNYLPWIERLRAKAREGGVMRDAEKAVARKMKRSEEEEEEGQRKRRKIEQEQQEEERQRKASITAELEPQAKGSSAWNVIEID